MFYLETNTGLIVEELRNGFLGHKVIYFLWHGKRLIATSLDRKNWKMSSWINHVNVIEGDKTAKSSLKPIDEKLFKALSQTGDI